VSILRVTRTKSPTKSAASAAGTKRVGLSPARRREFLDRCAKLGEDLGTLILGILDPAPEEAPAEPFSAASLDITDPTYPNVVDVRDRLIKARRKGSR